MSSDQFSLPFVIRAKPIVALAMAVLAGTSGNILDLGCGNGMLLKKIHEASPATVSFGIDVAPSRIEHARNDAPAILLKSALRLGQIDRHVPPSLRLVYDYGAL